MGAERDQVDGVAGGVVLALLALAAPARAQSDGPRIDLTPCIAPVRAGDTPARVLAQPARFDCTTPQTRFGPGRYWVRLDGVPPAAGAGELLYLRMASLWQDALTVRSTFADGATTMQTIDSRALTRHIQIGAIVEIPIPARAAPLDSILLRVDGAANLHGIVVAPRLEHQAQAFAAKLQMTAVYAGFGGLALALLVYNFMLWLTMRHRFQLWYCAMILATLGYAFTSSGTAAEVFPSIDNNDRLRLNYLLLVVSACAAIQFLGAFFEQHIIPRWLRRAVNWACIAMLAGGGAFALFAPFAIGTLDQVYMLSIIGALALAVPFTYYASVRRSQFLWMFVIAWAAPFAVTVLRALHGLDLIGYSFWLDNGTILAMGAESLLNSLAIAYRIKLLSDERDRAQADTSEARALASADPLTGVLNRRAFLDAAIGRRGGWRLLLLDIDHFKAVNDQIGHDGGDDVLKAFALALRKWQPDDSFVARLGGEEFCVLIRAEDCEDYPPGTLLDYIRNQRMPEKLRVTASLGVADGRLDTEDDWRSMYRRADMALYGAKATGRNRYVMANGEGVRAVA